MSKFRKWILSLGIAAAPGVMLGASVSQAAPPAATASQAQNQQMANRIANVLRTAKLAGSNIDIAFGDGVCTLTGQTASFQQKTYVTQLVSQVPGVVRVDNRLTAITGQPSGVQPAGFTQSPQPAVQQVSHQESCAKTAALPPAARQAFTQPTTQLASYTPPTPPASPVSNQQMAERIGSALRQARLGSQPIEIQFQNGRAVLLGQVANTGMKQVAHQVASSVPGVNGVDNRLSVSAPVAQTAYQPPMPPAAGTPAPPAAAPQMMAPPMMAPPQFGMGGPGMNPAVYDNPAMPPYAWPATAQYPNVAAIQYPTQYSPSAFPYIGPFYPYPQVPPDWRKVSLEWDDGLWQLDFDSKTDKWWWFANPKNW